MRFTLDPPPGLAADDTSFAAAGRWADASNVRFWRGRAQVIGGWERLHPGRLAGPCRGLLGWTDYDQPAEIVTPYFPSSGTGQINAVFPVGTSSP